MPIITCIDDMRALAYRRIPRLCFDYLESGSWTQTTARRNVAAMQAICFRQRVARDISTRDTATTLLGHAASMPVAISPTGMAGILHPDGELAVARAAAAAGIPYGCSIASSYSLEAVRKASSGVLWMQLSILKDRPFMQRMIERAREQGCAALILTLDFHVAGQRNADLRNGFGLPPRPSLAALLNIATRPKWCWTMRRRAPVFGNIIGYASGVTDLASFGRWYAGQFELRLNWGLVEWVKSLWRGPLIVKGILDEEDARYAIEAGADAISVSNQGGRQLDGASAAIDALPAIARAVRARVQGAQGVQILMDGGIRSGQDVLKALALGAQGVLVGRAPLYGLSAQGARGVARILDIVRTEMDLTLAMCGCPSAREFSATNLWNPPLVQRVCQTCQGTYCV